jgi:hypothetical protein
MQWQNVNPHGSGNGRLQWKITKKSTVKPVIVGSKVKDGKKHFVGKDGTLYEAEVFERVWGKVKELI